MNTGIKNRLGGKERSLLLAFDGTLGTWTLVGDGPLARLSDERREIVDLLREVGPLTPAQIALRLGKNGSTIRTLLGRLLSTGLIAKDGDIYSVAVGTPAAAPPISDPMAEAVPDLLADIEAGLLPQGSEDWPDLGHEAAGLAAAPIPLPQPGAQLWQKELINRLVDSRGVRSFNHLEKIVCRDQSTHLAHLIRETDHCLKGAVVTVLQLWIIEIHDGKASPSHRFCSLVSPRLRPSSTLAASSCKDSAFAMHTNISPGNAAPQMPQIFRVRS